MEVLSRDNDASPPANSIGWRLTLVSYLLIIPSAISTVLRLWARADARALGKDDWSILAGTAFAIVMSALSIVGVQHGKGQHTVYLSEAQILWVSKLSFINQIVLFIALCLVKMSICFLVLRIQGNAKWLRWSLWIVMAFMVVTTLEASISLLAECDPVRGYWDRGLVKQEKATCHTPEVRIYSIYVQAGMSDHEGAPPFSLLTSPRLLNVYRPGLLSVANPNRVEVAPPSAKEARNLCVDGHGIDSHCLRRAPSGISRRDEH